MPDNDPQDRNV